MRAYVLIHARAGEAVTIARELRQAQGVVRADYVFGNYDVIAEVEAQDLPALGHLVYESVRVMPGVLDTHTCLAVD